MPKRIRVKRRAGQRPNQQDNSSDRLWGGSAIAGHIGRTLRATYYLIETGKIPVTKLGPKTITASKRKIDRALDKEDSDAR
jgi:hypothetical protein